jgi:hypothetical protein
LWGGRPPPPTPGSHAPPPPPPRQLWTSAGYLLAPIEGGRPAALHG